MPARITSIYAEMETVYAEPTPGTFPTGTEAMLVYGDPAAAYSVDQQFDDVQPLTGTKTPQRQVPGITKGKSAVQVLLQGGGQPAITGPGAKPYFDTLLRMSGFEYSSPAITPAPTPLRTRHRYRFRDANYESGRVGVYNELVRQILAGALANCKIAGDAGKSIKCDFDISGQVREIVSDSTPPTPTLPANRALRLMKTHMKFVGHPDGDYMEPFLFARVFELNTGWTIDDRPDFAQTTSENGLAGVEMGVRAPTFSVTIEAEKDLTHFDPFKRLISGDVSETISFTVKSLETPDPLDMVTFTITHPQTRTITKSVAGDRLLYQLQMNLQNETAQNELFIDFDSLDKP
jgi:hypothetical protein